MAATPGAIALDGGDRNRARARRCRPMGRACAARRRRRAVGRRRCGAHAPSARDERRVINALDLIEARYAEPLSVGAIAGAVHMSPYHFLRVFRAVAGVTPHQYLVRTRLRHAAIALATTDQPIADDRVRAWFRRPVDLRDDLRARVRRRAARVSGELARGRRSRASGRAHDRRKRERVSGRGGLGGVVEDAPRRRCHARRHSARSGPARSWNDTSAASRAGGNTAGRSIRRACGGRHHRGVGGDARDSVLRQQCFGALREPARMTRLARDAAVVARAQRGKERIRLFARRMRTSAETETTARRAWIPGRSPDRETSRVRLPRPARRSSCVIVRGAFTANAKPSGRMRPSAHRWRGDAADRTTS